MELNSVSTHLDRCIRRLDAYHTLSGFSPLYTYALYGLLFSVALTLQYFLTPITLVSLVLLNLLMLVPIYLRMGGTIVRRPPEVQAQWLVTYFDERSLCSKLCRFCLIEHPVVAFLVVSYFAEVGKMTDRPALLLVGAMIGVSFFIRHWEMIRRRLILFLDT